MARPKGSKNKTRIVKANFDYAAVVAEKTAEKEKSESEVAALTANLDDLKTQLKAKKAELKAATDNIGGQLDHSHAWQLQCLHRQGEEPKDVQRVRFRQPIWGNSLL